MKFIQQKSGNIRVELDPDKVVTYRSAWIHRYDLPVFEYWVFPWDFSDGLADMCREYEFDMFSVGCRPTRDLAYCCVIVSTDPIVEVIPLMFTVDSYVLRIVKPTLVNKLKSVLVRWFYVSGCIVQHAGDI